MSTAELIYKGEKTDIQCNENEKLEEIIKRFCLKLELNIENMYYLYAGNIADMNSTFVNLANSEDKKRNKISILVHDKEIPIDERYLQKSKYIICPECKDNMRMKIKDYKIELYDCQNQHNIKNISISEFEKLQTIDQSKIICDKCKIMNKSKTYNNSFFICVSCNQNICPLCKSSHEKDHIIFDCEEKFFKCNLHTESYIFYCEQCKKNICLICEKDHINHKRISLGEMMPDKNKIEEEKNNLRNKLDEFENEIQNIINKLNDVVKNMEMYYNIIDDLVSGYDIRKRNFQILKNLNDISENNDIILKDLNQIINEKDINIKFKNIINIYDKINFKEIKDSNIAIEIKDSSTDEIIDLIKMANEGSRLAKQLQEELKKFNRIKDYFSFDIETIKKINHFNIKNYAHKIIILKDERILCYQNSNFSAFSIYRLEDNNNAICDFYEAKSGIKDIIQLVDGNLLLSECDYLKLYQLKEKEIVFLKEKKLEMHHLSNTKLYYLSNKKIVAYADGNSNVYIYSYKNNNLINDKSINTGKYGVIDVCEINKKEIAISCYVHGKLYGTNDYILFYDLEKDQKIKMLDIGGKLCYLNEEDLIVVSDKIYLIDLIKHKIKTKITCKNTDFAEYKVFSIHEKGFIVVRSNLYYYEIEKKSKIVFKGEKIIYLSQFITKYQGNKLLIGKSDSIDIYEY